MARSQQRSPRSILRSASQSTNTTKRVTFADMPLASPVAVPPAFARRAPPSVIPPRSALRGSKRGHTCGKHGEDARAAAQRRRRRRADGVVKKTTRARERRTVGRKKATKKKGRKCKRGLVYARVYVAGKCAMEDGGGGGGGGGGLEAVEARLVYKMYAEIRKRLGKKVDEGLRRRMVDEEEAAVGSEKRGVRKRRRALEGLVVRLLPGVKTERLDRQQLAKAAVVAVVKRFERVQRRERALR